MFYFVAMIPPGTNKVSNNGQNVLYLDVIFRICNHAAVFWENIKSQTTMPERIHNPITAMGFLAMFTFQLDNTKR